MSKLRSRVYGNYVGADKLTSQLSTVEQLTVRKPTMDFLIHNFFPSEKIARILDLGCGHGTLVHFAHQHGYTETFGVDVSAQQVQLAEHLGIKNIHQGDLLNTLNATPESSMDVVIAFDVIEHFSKSELLDFVDAVQRVLKPGGRWIIHAPNGGSPFVGTVLYGDMTHEWAFTEASLNQLLLPSGFKKITLAECAPQIYSLKSFFRVLIWKLVRGALRIALAAETGDLGSGGIFTRNLYAVAWK